MQKWILLFLSVGFFTLLIGCSSLATMRTVPRINSIDPNLSLINFVRPSNFLGAASNRELWDESIYIGSSSNGSMIQYQVKPGKHLFLTNNYNKGWRYLQLDLEPGKIYYVRVEVYSSGFELEKITALDEESMKWINSLTVKSIDLNKSKGVPKSEIEEAAKHANRIKRANDAKELGCGKNWKPICKQILELDKS